MKRRGAPSEAGFILPIVLFTILIFAMAAIVSLEALSGLRARTERARAASEAELAFASVEARAAHLLLTEPLSLRSVLVGGDRTLAPGEAPVALIGASRMERRRIVEAPIDGAPMVFLRATAAPVMVSLRDEAGLLNLNGQDAGIIEAALVNAGERPATARRLAAALADYGDEDDLVRDFGAEAADYERLGLPAPRNRPLRQPGEALSALGWRASEAAEAIRPSSSAAPAERPINLNAADAATLKAALGADDKGVAAALRRRAQAPFQDVTEAIALAGGGGEAADRALSVTPSRRFRLDMSVTSGGARTPFRTNALLILAPQGADRPYFVWRDFFMSSPGGARPDAAGTEDRRRFPDSPTLLSARER